MGCADPNIWAGLLGAVVCRTLGACLAFALHRHLTAPVLVAPSVLRILTIQPRASLALLLRFGVGVVGQAGFVPTNAWPVVLNCA